MRKELLRFGGRTLGLVTHNFFWKVMALAGATVIWALVASEPELSTFTTVRVEFRNLPSDVEISSTPMETVTLELRGPAGELRGPGENRRPAVMLDMGGVMPGWRTFQIDSGDVNLPRGVRLVGSVPSEIRFDFERRAIREIPVRVRFAGEGASGYVIAGYSVSPDKLEIEGPASHVAQVAAAVTDPVDVSTATGTAQFRVNAFVSDAYVRFEQSPQVVVTVKTRPQARH
jgi:YbbR domain-containing protein